jgi:hypothetical protein
MVPSAAAVFLMLGTGAPGSTGVAAAVASTSGLMMD